MILEREVEGSSAVPNRIQARQVDPKENLRNIGWQRKCVLAAVVRSIASRGVGMSELCWSSKLIDVLVAANAAINPVFSG